MAVVLRYSFHTLGGPIAPATAPLNGSLLVVCAATRTTTSGPSALTGWVSAPEGVLTTTAHHPRDHMMFYKVWSTGDPTSWGAGGTWIGTDFTYMEFTGVNAFYDSVGTVVGFTNSVVCGGAITVPSSALIVGGCAADFTNDTDTMTTAPGASITEVSDKNGLSSSPGYWTAYRAPSAGTYTISGTATMGGGGTTHGMAGHTMAFLVDQAPVADFEADVHSGVVPTTVVFTDLSGGIPTSWSWDFGDGGTSTSQNPSHVYTVAGTYSVTLTATNAFGSDAETKTAFITISADVGYEDPLPGAALVEIYAAEAGAARWDVATWDDAVWSTGAWQDVTPESVNAKILWGSNRPELGVLSKPDAGSWAIAMYDPERLLDPANADGPFYTDLLPGLPVRITHRGIVVRQGIMEALTHEFADDSGILRVQDNIAPLANASVPSDTELSDTLYARAVDAIEAAGLSITVLPVPPSGDPAVAAWETGVNDWTAWQWITDAAEQALHIAYIDRIGRLGFRAWASPLSRSREIAADQLIGLTSIVQYNGLFSQITALDSVTDTVETRALTPPPRYGVRTYSRTAPTLDAGDWADAVLLDRAFTGLRWVPGTIYPLTANAVELFATIEAVEQIGLVHSFTSPEVIANLVVVGGEIEITAKRDDEAKWWFTFEAAQVSSEASLPLITEDETGFVVDEVSGLDYVYPE